MSVIHLNLFYDIQHGRPNVEELAHEITSVIEMSDVAISGDSDELLTGQIRDIRRARARRRQSRQCVLEEN